MENENMTAQQEEDVKRLAAVYQCALSALRNYVQSEDYKLLSQYAPTKASLLASVNGIDGIDVGLCPKIVPVRVNATAWGEVKYIGSDMTRRIKKLFSFECLLWINTEDLSADDFSKVMRKANLGVTVYSSDEYSLKGLLRSKGKKALDEEVEGWNGVYVDLERVTYDSLEKLREPVAVGIFPIHIKQSDGSSFTVGLLDSREESMSAEIFPMGETAKSEEERRLKRKRNKKIVLGVVGGALLALTVILVVLLL